LASLERRWSEGLPDVVAVRYVLMAAARPFRQRPEAEVEVERSSGLIRAGCSTRVVVAAAAVVPSGQAPPSPAADRRKLALRLKAMALPEAWACR
jgi:hypothetical protein